jgi:hypothetical protein
VGYSERDLREMAAQARAVAASLADRAIRFDFLMMATRLEREADAQQVKEAPSPQNEPPRQES